MTSPLRPRQFSWGGLVDILEVTRISVFACHASYPVRFRPDPHQSRSRPYVSSGWRSGGLIAGKPGDAGMTSNVE